MAQSQAKAQAQPPSQVQLAAVGTTASEPTLTVQATRWLARQLGMSAQKVQVQAPDPRVRQPACAAPLQFDTPFSNLHTVRVRCSEPQWQLFLRAQWEGEDEAPAAPAVARTDPTPSRSAERAQQPPAEPRRGLALSRALPRGAMLSPASAEFITVAARDADTLLLTDQQALEQMEAVRDLPAGTVLRSTDVRPATLVRQGQLVLMTVGQGTGFTVSVRLEALQDGRMGDRVTLRNAESGRTVSGVVTGVNTVRGT